MDHHYQKRCAELEEILERCLAALDLIPADQLRKGYQWFPSEEALKAIERGKEMAFRYAVDHWD